MSESSLQHLRFIAAREKLAAYDAPDRELRLDVDGHPKLVLTAADLQALLDIRADLMTAKMALVEGHSRCT